MLYKENSYDKTEQIISNKISNEVKYNERKYRKEVVLFYEQNKDILDKGVLVDDTDRELRKLVELSKDYIDFKISGIILHKEILSIIQNTKSYIKLRNYFI